MSSVSMTARRQVTFRKDVVEHLGLKPGQKMELDKLPDGRVMLSASRQTGSIDDFIGCLKGKSKVKLTIEEINEAIADGWAGRR